MVQQAAQPVDFSWEKPETISRWPRNPRSNAHAVDRVAQSIRRFGFASPIVVNRPTRQIVAGDTRYQAAQRLGLPLVPVRWMDLTEAEATALAIADNRTGEIADWIDPELGKLLHELQLEDARTFELSDLGFTGDEITDLLAKVVQVEAHTRVPATERPPARPTPGAATLLEGDCLHVMRTLPDCSIDSVVTDAPYGLSGDPDIVEVLTAWLAGTEYVHDKPGFMGEKWDSFVPGPAVWREAYRVLKPGGYLVCFAGTTTHDLMGISIRLAGFQKRDLGEWAYWSGYPKSQDAARLIDRRKVDRLETLRVCGWIREACTDRKVSRKALDEHFGTVGMASHWTSKGSQPTIPTAEQWPEVVKLLGEPPAEIAELVAHLHRKKGQPGDGWFDRAATGQTETVDTAASRPGMPNRPNVNRTVTTTAAGSEESRPWEGWGTGLLPAHEPYLIFRKPFRLHEMTLADNLLENRTGAMNLRGCRIPAADPMWPGRGDERWPPNLVHVKKPSQEEKQAGCESIEPVTGAEAVKRKAGSKGVRNPRAGAGRTAKVVHNDHKTVKPIRLMAWIVRLFTPPGGRVLDMFMGSGTTLVGAVCQGFEAVGIDLSPRNVEIAGQRLAYWKERGIAHLLAADTGTDEQDPDEPGAEV